MNVWVDKNPHYTDSSSKGSQAKNAYISCNFFYVSLCRKPLPEIEPQSVAVNQKWY